MTLLAITLCLSLSRPAYHPTTAQEYQQWLRLEYAQSAVQFMDMVDANRDAKSSGKPSPHFLLPDYVPCQIADRLNGYALRNGYRDADEMMVRLRYAQDYWGGWKFSQTRYEYVERG